MRPSRFTPWLALLAMLVALPAWGAPDAKGTDPKETARRLLTRTQQAIVTVRVVAVRRMVVMGREVGKSEQTSEMTATIIDPGGLTVTSNFSANPDVSPSGDETSGRRVQVDVMSVTIQMADGTEIPARFVLRDKDLDLAFIKPLEPPAAPLPCVTFSKPTVEPQVLDDTVMVSRLGRVVNREPMITLGRIQAIVTKPRTCYLGSFVDGFFCLGCPVFLADGQTLGFMVLRVNTSTRSSGPMDFLGTLQPVVLPSATLLEVAKQAAAIPAKGP